jgi:hypothetical protein
MSFSRVHVRALTNINALYGITRGTAAANKGLVCDGSTNITGLTLTNPTLAGTITGVTSTAGVGSTQCARVSAQTDVTSSTTLTAITGLAISLLAGATYAIQVYIPVTATATPGAKFSLDTSDTLTATSISYAGTLFNATTPAASSVTTTLGNAVASVAGAGTYAILDGTIVVNAAGTLVVKIAQNTSNGTATSALVNGYMQVTRIA